MTQPVPRCLLAALLLAMAACACGPSASPPRPEPGPPIPVEPITERHGDEDWAEPTAGGDALPNLYRVSDDLLRGAQPESEGFAQLRALGVKTVVNLRTFSSDRSECEEHELGYVHITCQASEPEDEEVVAFLRVATDRDTWPIFVHCRHGADRTGLMCAIYRMAVEGWSREDALREMVEGPYGFHTIWKDLVTYVREVDVDALMARVGESR